MIENKRNEIKQIVIGVIIAAGIIAAFFIGQHIACKSIPCESTEENSTPKNNTVSWDDSEILVDGRVVAKIGECLDAWGENCRKYYIKPEVKEVSVEKIKRINGVVTAMKLDKYSVLVNLSKMYEWDEIQCWIVEALGLVSEPIGTMIYNNKCIQLNFDDKWSVKIGCGDDEKPSGGNFYCFEGIGKYLLWAHKCSSDRIEHDGWRPDAIFYRDGFSITHRYKPEDGSPSTILDETYSH